MNRKERRRQDKRARQARGAAPAVAVLLDRGLACHHAGRLEDAVALYREVLAAQPEQSNALNYCGVASYQLGRIDEAVTLLRHAARLEPAAAGIHNNLANALRAAGALDEAVAAYRRAVEIQPDYAEAYNNLAKALQDLGSLDAAEAALRRVLAIRPDYAEAYRQLAELRHGALDHGAIAAMERHLADDGIGDADAIQLCFALGNAYEDLGDYDRAFARFAQGNRLKRATIQYDIAADEAWAERVMGVFDEALLSARAGHGEPADSPVFIVGMPRSGTTLVEQILASHADVYGAGELATLGRLVADLDRTAAGAGGFPEAVAELETGALRALGQSYIQAVAEHAPAAARRITDKMPSNFFCLGLIHLILPNAKIVNCTRDPIDTGLACYKKLFSSGQPFTYDLAEVGRYQRLFDRVMKHWRAVLPGRILDVRYEDVVENLEREARRLVAFAALPWDPACLTPHRTQRAVRTASAAQVRRPIYRSALQRWRHYEAHLAPLLTLSPPAA